MKKKNFLCPTCKVMLRIGDYVVLVAKKKDDNDKAGILLLSPEIGNYKIIKHEDFELKDGEHISFHCPACLKSLSSDSVKNDLAKLLMFDEENNAFEISFSEIAGKHSTYKVSIEDDDTELFGDDYAEYASYFNL